MENIDDVLVTIPHSGDVVIAIGNKEVCAPCRKLEEFMDANAEKLGVKFVSLDLFEFSKKYPEVKVVAIPKVMFMRNGKVIYHYEGFSNGERFVELMNEVFG